MVTTKRQIRKDSDRFGGYYGAESGSTLISDLELSDLEPITAPERRPSGMIMTDIDTDITEREPIAAPKVLYTTLDTARTEAAPAAPALVLPKREKREVRLEKEDLLPTVKTRAYANVTVKEDAESAEKASSAQNRRRKVMDRKTKILLFVYLAVALVLAVAVIATGVSISTATAKADAYTAQIAQKQTVIADIQSQIETLGDAETVRDKAYSLGMVDAGAPAYSVDAIESFGYPEATPRTDGFDKFCDWLSKLIN